MTTAMNAIIVREATDDFLALRIADAMQSLAHVDVVSIVNQPAKETIDGFYHSERWHVFAKFADDMTSPDKIDAVIGLELGK